MNDDRKPDSFGWRLGRIRRGFHRRVTQAELAAHLGVAPQAISAWERDASVPENNKLQMIANFFGITINDLFLEGPLGPTRTSDVFISQFVPATEFVGNRDLPIYAATAGGDGHMIVTTDIIERALPRFAP